MGATAVVGGGMALQGASALFGAHSQAQANDANLAASQANRAQLMQMINQQMGGGQNPYAGMYMSALQSLGSGQGQGAGQGQLQLGGQGTPTDLNMGMQFQRPGPGMIGDANLGTPGMSAGGLAGMTPYFDLGGETKGGMPSSGTGGDVLIGPDGMGQRGGSIDGSGPQGSQGTGTSVGRPQQAMQQQAVGSFTPYNPLSAQIQNPYTYQAAQLGQAPTVGQFGQIGASMLTPQQQQGVQQVSAPGQTSFDRVQAGQIGAQQIQSPQQQGFQRINAGRGFNAPQISAPAAVGTQGMNAGQDALMQMMRANVAAPSDASLQQNMQNQIAGVGGGGQFDPTALLNSMKANQQNSLNEQVAGLQGSAGSLGQRFGTGMANAEGRLRTNLAGQFDQQNQQVAQTAFENAANRSSQALGLQQGYQQSINQLPFQQAQLQQQAAIAGGGLQQQGSQLDLQAQIQNAMNSLQAQQSNQGAALQSGLQSQNLGFQAQQANQQAGLQNNQFYAQLGQQAGLANQQTGLAAQQANQQAGLNAAQMNQQAQLQTGSQYSAQQLQALLANQQAGIQNNQFYSQLGQQAGIANQNAGLAAQQSNQQAQMQALLANQSMAGQYGLANQSALNQAGQFNAQAGMAQSAFNAQQGNQFNQLQQALAGQAQGAQQWQQQYNAGLIGLLAGMPLPQQQASPYPSALGTVGNDAMTMALLQQFMGQQQPQQPNYTTITQRA